VQCHDQRLRDEQALAARLSVLEDMQSQRLQAQVIRYSARISAFEKNQQREQMRRFRL